MRGVPVVGLLLAVWAGLAAQGYLQNDAVTTHTSGITLNEVSAKSAVTDFNADGVTSNTSDKDEFIEIVNSAGTAIDIGGWTLSDNNTQFTFPTPTVLQPGRAVVVFTQGANVSNFNPGSGNMVFSTAGMALKNTGDAVGLKNTSGLYIAVHWGSGTLDPDFVSGATLVGTDVALSSSWNNGQSQSRSPDYTGSWIQHPTVPGTVNWSNNMPTVTLTNPQGSPGRKVGQDISLPVSLSRFTALAGDGQVVLQWVTESETGNLGFEVWRAAQREGPYTLLSSYRNNPALQGRFNSSERTNYQFTDRAVANGLTYWYRLVDVDVNGTRTLHGPISATPMAAGPGLLTVNPSLPRQVRLLPGFPNPFNPTTTLRFEIPAGSKGPGRTRLTIYNPLGRRVCTLVDAPLAAGTYQVQWDGTGDGGQPLPAGVYYAVLRAYNRQRIQKLVLVK